MGVLNDGLAEFISLIGNSQTGVKVSGINIGTDGTAFDATHSALLNELDRAAGLSTTQTTTSVTGDTMEISNTFSNNSGTVKEAGLYTDDTDDTQVTRQVVSDINLESSDSLEVTFELQAQNA